MPQPPLTYLEKKWALGGSTNLLFGAAVQDQTRKSIPFLDYDSHRNVSTLGRRTMMSLGRWLFANFSTVRGALLEQAEYASSHYIFQYNGENAPWGEAAEEWLQQHDLICDVRGAPYNMRLYRRNLILAVLRDGDHGTMLVKNRDGYPMLQAIPSHRIGSRMTSQSNLTVEGGPYDGARIVDGVIVNDQGAPIAYRIMGENPYDSAHFTDVPARDFFLSFIPEYPDQVRGFSALGASLFDWQDVSEFRRFELIAQKVGAALTLIEKNEAGAPIDGADQIVTAAGDTPTTGTPTGLVNEILDGGLIRYLKSTDPNAALEMFKNDRPTAAQQSFEDKILRSAMCGMHWSIDFSLKPGDVGRSSTRVVISKINRALEEKQDLILEPACRRIDGFRLGCATNEPLRILDQQWDWYKSSYQGPPHFTADAQYDSQIDINENRAGMKPLRDIAGPHGEYWEDIQDQMIAEEKRLQARCKEEGVDPNRVKLLTPNGNAGVANESAAPSSERDPAGANEGANA